mmetsp:Transcript_2049/g.3041  ORF Transcript_2049/g.3041 Transcript_2049/m.3041 type:complete len:92 (+) Transcript_2049:425-700(+)
MKSNCYQFKSMPIRFGWQKNDGTRAHDLWGSFDGFNSGYFENVLKIVRRYQNCSAVGEPTSSTSLLVKQAKKRKVQLLEIDVCSDEEDAAK